MALRLPNLTSSWILRIFFILTLGGIGAGAILSFADTRTKDSHWPIPLYYGKKRAKHVAPESMVGPAALGADFAEVYVAACAAREWRENGETQYQGFRPVAYPPLTLWLYGWLKDVPYPRVLAVHSVVSLGAFLLSVTWVYFRAGMLRHLWKVGLLTLAVCFCTPAGFSHFERGQFDLFTSAAIFLCLAPVWMDRGRVSSALAGGFFSALKLSAVPFLGTFSLAALLSDAPRRRLVYLVAPGVLVASLLVFAGDLPRLAEAMQHMEGAAAGGKAPIGEKLAIRGVSFLLLMPPLLAKSVQILSALVFLVALRWVRDADRPGRFAAAAFPFALAMVIQGMAYGAGSWEYRIVALLGVAAAFVLWVEKVPGLERLQGAVGLGFGVFLLLASRVFHFAFYPKPSWQAPVMSGCYLAFSLAFLAVAIGSGRGRPTGGEEKVQP